MKKLIFLLIGLFIVTGCFGGDGILNIGSGNKLTCVMEEVDEESEFRLELEYIFKNDKIDSGKMEVMLYIKDEEGREFVYPMMEGIYLDGFKEYDHITARKVDDSERLIIVVEFSDIDESLYEDLGDDFLLPQTATLEKTKNQLEEEGFTCN